MINEDLAYIKALEELRDKIRETAKACPNLVVSAFDPRIEAAWLHEAEVSCNASLKMGYDVRDRAIL